MSAKKQRKSRKNRTSEVVSPSGASRCSLSWLFAAFIVLIGAVIYWPATHGPFVLDDFDFLEASGAFQNATYGGLIGNNRPIVIMSYLANYRLAGFDPSAFHKINIALHCLNALILWRLVVALFVWGKLPQRITMNRCLFVYGLPLLFLLSPIQTESVAYVSSRTELLAMGFFLLGLWAFVSNRERRPWLSAALVLGCFVLATLSKQDKLILPVVILLLDYLILSSCNWRELRKNLPLYGLLAGGIAIGALVVIRPILFAPSAGFGLDWQTYLLTQFRMYFRYLGQLVWPFELNLDPDIVPSHSLFEHGAVLALVALVAILAAIARWHRTLPVISFGALLFFAALAPTTSFFPLLDFAAERRLYLPSVGFFLVVLGVVSFLEGRHRKLVAATLVTVLLAYGVGTYRRSIVWADDLTLWQDTVKKSPEKARPWSWLGKVYDERGLVTQAQGAWMEGVQFAEQESDEHATLLGNLGLSQARQKNYAQAVEYYEQALVISPGQKLIWAQLAVALMRLDRTEEGWQAFERAMEGFRINYAVRILRAQELYVAGRYAEAVDDFRRALDLQPELDEVRRNLEVATRAARQAGQLP
jgi:tetratricopeptide (TPR) repeat protein